MSDPGPWWRSAVTYQVYLRSFADSDGDGSGDLAGLTARLDYIADLGVDALWLNPCYASPQRDGGYDVADYFSIDAMYGNLDELDLLVAAAHERGMRLLLDIVPNHCSQEHSWFRSALTEGPGGTHRERFLFRDGRGHDGDQPPSNWQSVFGGPAWTRVTDVDGRPDQWYLHSFDSSQPDFDWRNETVRTHFEDVLRFWFDRGVDGFRIDVASMLIKHPDLPDVDGPDNPHNGNQPEVHEIYRRWRALTDTYLPARQLTLVGEVWAPSPEHVAAYVRADELHQAFSFDLLAQPWDAAAFCSATETTLRASEAVGGTLAWTLNNHDVHRSVSRYGLRRREGGQAADPMGATLRPRGEIDTVVGEARARAGALFLLGLPGSAYLYQGEELGLPEVQDLADHARRDPIWARSHGTEHGRDGCRIPLPWTADAPHFGFTDGDSPPWLPQPEWFAKYAVHVQQADQASTLAFYRAAVRARRALFTDAPHNVSWLLSGRADVLAYQRGDVVAVTVFGGAAFALPDDWGTLALRSDLLQSRLLPPNCAAWLLGSAMAESRTKALSARWPSM